MKGPVVFALQGSDDLGRRIASALSIEVGVLEERDFPEGEHKVRPDSAVRGRDVYVVHSLFGSPEQSVNDKLCRILFVVRGLKDAGAARVTALTPYLCYSRKDRRTKARDPVTTRYVATLFEAMGLDGLVTLDVHNLAAFQNAFRIPTEHLEIRPLLARELHAHVGGRALTVLSPDTGGIRRAGALAADLELLSGQAVPVAVMEKSRSEGQVRAGRLVGDVADRTVVIVDDLIGTGSTLALAAGLARRHGAQAVHCAATHGMFVGAANAVFADDAIDSLWVGDSVPPFRLTDPTARAKLRVLDTAPLFAGVIEALHTGGSVEALRQVTP